MLTLENELENWGIKRVDKALLTCTNRANLKRTNRKN